MVKFDHFKIRVVNNLLCSQKLDSVAVAYPVFDDIGSACIISTSICHICQRDVVLPIDRDNGNLILLHVKLSHEVIIHFSSCPSSSITELIKASHCPGATGILLRVSCIFGADGAKNGQQGEDLLEVEPLVSRVEARL